MKIKILAFVKKTVLTDIFAVLVIFVLPFAAAEEAKDEFAAPFGLEWGMSKSDVESLGVTLTGCERSKILTVEEHEYVEIPGDFLHCGTESLPKNLSDAKIYHLWFSPKYGLVAVFHYRSYYNIAGEVEDGDARVARKRHEELKAKLTAKYGKPTAHRFSSTIWRPNGVKDGSKIELFFHKGFLDLKYFSVFYDIAQKEGEAEREAAAAAVAKEEDDAL